MLSPWLRSKKKNEGTAFSADPFTFSNDRDAGGGIIVMLKIPKSTAPISSLPQSPARSGPFLRRIAVIWRERVPLLYNSPEMLQLGHFGREDRRRPKSGAVDWGQGRSAVPMRATICA